MCVKVRSRTPGLTLDFATGWSYTGDAVSDVAPVSLPSQAVLRRDSSASGPSERHLAGRRKAKRATDRPRVTAAKLHLVVPHLSGVNETATEADRLLGLVRELQTELTHKAEAAATWQARAEMLTAELAEARRALDPRDDSIDDRPWWRRWLWTLAPCLAVSLQLV